MRVRTPTAFPFEDGTFGIDFEYLYGVCDQTAAAIHEAAAGLKPTKLKIATGKAEGKIAYNLYAPDLYDPRCSVIQGIGSDGAALFTLVNYANHPEVLLEKDVCSPDFVGPLHDRIEAQGGGMGLFINGAQGGMVTADIRQPDGSMLMEWSECVRIGALLADEALRIVGPAKQQDDPALACYAQPITLPVKPELSALLQMMHPEALRHFATPITTLTTTQNLLKIGNALCLTIPGEALPNIGYYLKRHMHSQHNLLFGITNDAFGYLMTKVDYDSFALYDYITATSLHETAGEILIEESLRFVNEIESAGTHG